MMFSDDTVLVGDSEEKLLKASERIWRCMHEEEINCECE